MDISTVEIEERGVRVRLTLVDTPGFDEGLDSNGCYAPLVEYIDKQFDKYLSDESGLNRRNISDNRVHCIFYFVSPFGSGLKHVDIVCLKSLHEKANIIILIGRADVLTSDELAGLKANVRAQLRVNKIKTYGDFVAVSIPAGATSTPCNQSGRAVDEIEMEFREQSRILFESMPFAICGSQQVFELKDKRVRGRMYQWGLVDIDNAEYCDFVKLRNTLTMHMQDLQDVTHELHYENYRSARLCQVESNQDILRTKQQELLEMEQKLQKMKAEMNAVSRQ
ncbi:hypothetical protein ACOME3_008681 [Neoechinorhynchus agilis]